MWWSILILVLIVGIVVVLVSGGAGGSGDSGVPTSRGYSRGGTRPDENGEPGLVVIF